MRPDGEKVLFKKKKTSLKAKTVNDFNKHFERVISDQVQPHHENDIYKIGKKLTNIHNTA